MYPPFIYNIIYIHILVSWSKHGCWFPSRWGMDDQKPSEKAAVCGHPLKLERVLYSHIHTIHYTLHTTHYILYTIYYVLYTIYYILYTIYYIITIYYIHYTYTTQKATPYDFHDFTRCFFPEVHAEVHSTPVYLWISHDERPSRRVSTVRRCSQWDLCQHIYGISIV